ncbi:MAG: PIN domain-containing protein [Lachnospiraceae bacterium]|nr:PIN domain-containing protein [Lachnospiraceae bacterium]
MDYVFIDTNIWLSLFHFTKNDLKQFEKLKTLVGAEIKLIVPSQLQDELRKNREAKLKDSLKDFSIKKPNVPAFAKEYTEFDDFNKAYNETEKKFKIWKDRIEADISAETTPADKVISDFFHVAGIVPCDESMVAAAYDRYNRGNPPGKNTKYGDAINWECLLRSVPDKHDLYLVSADKDYRSLLSEKEMNPFLIKEWREKKNAEVHFFVSLVDFLNTKFEEIQLRDEQLRQGLIDGLLNSHNYATTHLIIKGLSGFNAWTEEQLEALCKAVVENSQVGNILGDIDVLRFYSGILSNVNYGKLSDCYTKKVMQYVFDIVEAPDVTADYEAEMDMLNIQ